MTCGCAGVDRRTVLKGGASTAALGLASCAVNPETGRSQFTAFMGPEDEARIGAEQHPKLLETFGGAYNDPALARYVGRIGGALALNARSAVNRFTFTVLDSDIVNAFATPGGYVYVSRGLLALCRNEAEMAGVVGHEIGHVAGRHGAERYSTGTLAGLGAAIASIGLAVLTGSGAPGQLIQQGASLYLASYSRDQEFESDMLGVRYNALAGYDPGAMADFLGQLRSNAQLDAQIRGLDPSVADQTNYLATHPRTVDRVRAAESRAGAFADAGTLNRDAFLGAVDGMVFGDQPAQGVRRGRSFTHPELRMTFTMPQGFTMVNGQTALQAFHKDGGAIIYDLAGFEGRNAADYIQRVWAKEARVQGLERLQVSGLDAGRGVTEGRGPSGEMTIRLAAIRDGDKVHRFIFAAPPNRARGFAGPFDQTLKSFAKISAREAAAIRPFRIDIVTVRSGDTPARLAARMPFDSFKMERWEVLNGRSRKEPLQAGEKLKTVRA